MTDNVQYQNNAQNNGWIPNDTIVETDVQADSSHRQGVFVGESYESRVALGGVADRSSLTKYGNAPSGLQITATDIWSRADATPTQQIWLAPTAQSIHTLASTSSDDDGAVIRLYGLSTWDSSETSQDITLPNGTTSGEVIIHRMKLLQTAAHPVLAGNVTATAAAGQGGTVTAIILAGDNQTQMAIYGVPSTKTALLYQWVFGIDKVSGAVASANFELRVNERPDLQTTGFIRKWNDSVQSTGASSKSVNFKFPLTFSGPCIIKIQGFSSAADIDGHASFILELADN